MKKLTLLVGIGAGYVLGTRAGREQYEKIVGTARSLWKDPRVQEKADQAQHLAKQKAGEAQEVVKEKAAERKSDDSSQSGGLSSVDTPGAPGQHSGGLP
ncbi:MAG: YtxH domain-containing protein [Nocardioides sp.]|nr:YtxH domain-containing protein [Nocardioides sp.]